jgi:hypothetical protein
MKPWVRIDADVFEHPKFAGITPVAFTAWTKALGHCRQFRTDGEIKARVVSSIANEKTRADLIERGLWHARQDGGVDVHDYDDYQLTEAVWKAKSEAGKAAAEKRRSDAKRMRNASESDGSPMPTDTDTDTDPEPKAEEQFGKTTSSGSKTTSAKGRSEARYVGNGDGLQTAGGSGVVGETLAAIKERAAAS